MTTVRQSTGGPGHRGVEDAPSTLSSGRIDGVLRLVIPRAGRSARRAPSRSSRSPGARCCSSASACSRSSGRWSRSKLGTRRRRSSSFYGVGVVGVFSNARPAGDRRVIRNSSSTTNTRSEGLVGCHQSAIVVVRGPKVIGLAMGASRASRSRWRETRSLAHHS